MPSYHYRKFHRREKTTVIFPDSKVHGVNLGPTGPRWASCWPHWLCYLGRIISTMGFHVLIRWHLYVPHPQWLRPEYTWRTRSTGWPRMPWSLPPPDHQPCRYTCVCHPLERIWSNCASWVLRDERENGHIDGLVQNCIMSGALARDLLHFCIRPCIWFMFSPVCSQITKFMGPTWGPPGFCRPQMGPMLAPWTLLSGFSHLSCQSSHV